MTASEPILKDEGLVLRWYPVTDTSRIVVWFTRDHGHLTTLVRGSQRPKSWVLGQYDLFQTCEVLFYARAKEDLHPLRECAPLNPRSALRRDWRACAGASGIADLLHRISPPLAAAPALYRHATRALDHLCARGASPAVLFWFELKVWQDLGVAPDLDSGAANPVFDVPRGRVREAGNDDGPRERPLTPGSASLLRALADADTPDRLHRLKLRPEQTAELAGHLDRFTAWHLDLDLRSRRHALAACA